MRFYDPFLYPFAALYSLATRWRNHLFEIGSKKSTSFNVPVIVVGNLSVGGTGKTPAIEYLIRQFQDRYRLAVISRGYKRKTSGFLLATSEMGPDDIGDEPFQVFQKFGEKVAVAVGESRALAIPQVLAERPETEVILLDDAFQHRYVVPDLAVLLTTFHKPFFEDRILPLGTLRESRRGAVRANAVVVTKCPNTLNDAKKAAFHQEIIAYAREGAPIIFAGIRYSEPIPISKGTQIIGKAVIVVTGIASNRDFLEEVRKRYEVLEIRDYPDHHRYSVADIKDLEVLYRKHISKQPSILTTEKDAVKLNVPQFLPFWSEIPIFALPMEMDLSETDRRIITTMVLDTVKKKNYRGE
ncbi:MAG: tetraacyldisaccharide 4'-kinase [Lunatimonas sp.]|uniref:tetraacyldisaccharide 4'-kinase n=1 Tax=Lunatimonas sp. TaxID=2060141 RepID=UPI00263BC5D6|nr:tetraacyldisaccharide 4'-kinase [Lunatimonas sp.]MCC5939498.1 tetraacyldisaccharide 4'-kinase [Lunatimonas sp.]